MTAYTVITNKGHVISIHIPRVGDDRGVYDLVRKTGNYQSTSPAWGMTEQR